MALCQTWNIPAGKGRRFGDMTRYASNAGSGKRAGGITFQPGNKTSLSVVLVIFAFSRVRHYQTYKNTFTAIQILPQLSIPRIG